MKPRTKDKIRNVVKKSLTSTRVAASKAHELLKKAGETARKRAFSQKEVNSASRKMARAAVTEALATKKAVKKAGSKIVNFSSEVAQSVRAGIEDAKRAEDR